MVVKLLLARGADPHRPNNDGATPLHLASFRGNKKMVRVLLRRGVDPNGVTCKGDTPLHWASMRGHKQVVQMLLVTGALPEKRNKRGENPLQKAKQFGHMEVFQVLYDFIHLNCSECILNMDRMEQNEATLTETIPMGESVSSCTLL